MSEENDDGDVETPEADAGGVGTTGGRPPVCARPEAQRAAAEQA